tara:strand:- start:1508 stop:2074 length:567 start_codon:yes stop_codon:yes gene_type:complete
MNNNLQQILHWALNPLKDGIWAKKIAKKNRDMAKSKEKSWGNLMIGQISNNQWTTKLGEGLVYDVLKLLGKNPHRPSKKGGYLPDWETDDAIWEVKTRNWTTSGTAGEKVLGTMYKYSDIPRLYGKPLKIVCVAYQEWELSEGNTRVFGDVSEDKQKILTLVKSMNIEYLKFNDLIQEYILMRHITDE